MSDQPGTNQPTPPQAAAPAITDQAAEPEAGWRIWLSLAVGLALALPVGWAMTWIAPLPFELGLFFFLIVGLLIGAIMYRIGLPAAPVARPRLRLMAGIVAAMLWSTTMMTEYLTCPNMVVSAVLPSSSRHNNRGAITFRLTPERRQAVADQVRQYVHARLKSNYPPGGLLGYMRWAASGGKMSVPRVIDNTTVDFELPQRRTWWIIRVVLSLVFTAGALSSQVSLLAAKPSVEPAEQSAHI